MVRSQPGDLLPRHRHSDSTDMNMLKGHGAHSQTGAFAEGTCVSESKGTIHDPLSLEYETQLLMVNRDSSVFLTDNGPFQGCFHTMGVSMLQSMTEAAKSV